MSVVHLVAGMVSACVMFLGAANVSGQTYPAKPIRIVTSLGSGDFTARLIAQAVSDPLGQQVIVDPRPAGVIPGQIVSRAPPDGYTILFVGSTFWVGTLLLNEPPYDPVRDFLPITLAIRTPQLLLVHPSLPVKSVKELIALAKVKPGELSFASGSPGGAEHLAAELFKSMAGVNIVRVSYSSTPARMTSLISGEVQLTFSNPAEGMPHVQSGRLRALAVTSAQPSALLPGLPTVAATLSGFESGSKYGVFAPAKTPAAIIDRLNQEIVRGLNRADTKEKLLSTGVEVVGSSPEQLAATIRLDMNRLGKLINDIGIRTK